MAVETRVIIDANAQNAIREIGKLDDAAADADKTIGKLDGQDVDVDTSAGVDGMDELRRAGDDAIESVKALSRTDARVDVDTADVATAAGDVDALQADAGTAIHMEIDVDADKLDTTKKKLDDVGESGRAGSAAIGGIGGSVSELPGVGALGPIAESLGQLTENALEGGESIKGIGKAVGILGGTAIVMFGIQKAMQSIADTKAFRADQVAAFRDALKETGSAAEAVVTVLEQAEGIKGRTGGIFGFFEGTEEITATLNEAKVSADLFIKAVTPGPEAAAANQELIDKLTAQKEALDTSREAQEVNTQAWIDAVKKSQDLDAAIEVVKETLEDNTKAVESNKEAHDFLATATDQTTEAQRKAKEKTDKLRDGYQEAADKADVLRHANELLRGDLDKRDAYLRLMDSFDDLKVKGQEAWDAAATGADDAESKARAYEEAQIDVKNQVLDYTDAIGKVPLDKTTNLLAKVDDGQLDTLKTDLNNLTGSTKVIDVRVRTAVDAAWNQVVNTVRLGGARATLGPP